MIIPANREHVRVDGRDGVFLVVWVDREQEMANIIALNDEGLVYAVPFSQIQPLDGDGRRTTRTA